MWYLISNHADAVKQSRGYCTVLPIPFWSLECGQDAVTNGNQCQPQDVGLGAKCLSRTTSVGL